MSLDEVKGTCLDLDAPAQGDWFPFFESHVDTETGKITYDDPKPDAGRVCIRSIVPLIEQHAAKRKQRSEFVLNPKTRSMERVSYIEDRTPEEMKADREEALDYMIVDFENFLDGKGQPIACTKENKLKLMAIPMFDRFAARCNELLREAGIKSAEEAEKN